MQSANQWLSIPLLITESACHSSSVVVFTYTPYVITTYNESICSVTHQSLNIRRLSTVSTSEADVDCSESQRPM